MPFSNFLKTLSNAFLFTLSVTTACDNPIDLNTASLSELDSLPYITATTAQQIIDFRPICSPLELTYSPKKISGITEYRVNNNWKYYDGQDCSSTCCRADASCTTPAPTSASTPTYAWATGSWSTCTATCGSGTQERTVSCEQTEDSSVSTVADAFCESDADAGSKPLAKQVCNTQECEVYAWVTGAWQECVSAGDASDSCEQTRDVTCYETTQSTASEDTACETESKPDTTQSCETCTRAATAAALEVDTSVTGVQSVQLDLLQQYNHEKCQTDEFYNLPDGSESNLLIVRRGCSPDLWVFVKRTTTVGAQDLEAANWKFNVEMIEDLLEDESGDNVEDATDDWSSYLQWESYNVTSGWITLNIGSDGGVGKYKLELMFKDHGESTYTSVSSFSMYVLFNPYSSSDDVYMSNTQNRNEYIENTQGLIWQGLSDDNTGFVWTFDQFNYSNLELAMNTIKRLPLSYRSNIVLVARQISYGVEADLCYGKWGSGSYTSGRPSGGYYCSSTKKNCRDPSSWRGTSEVFAVYRTVLKPVQYCQCFVYAGVTTTVGRSLGIPTRPVSTFQSAHDTNFNRAIEKFYIFDEATGIYDPTTEGTDNTDSIWSFHVWNEMWFERSDVDGQSSSSASGWQAVDSTPQELSVGGNPGLTSGEKAYMLGPASIDLVKQNDNSKCVTETYTEGMGARYGCYDAEFVIGEVNANFNFWYKKGKDATNWILFDSFTTDPWGDDFGTIGLQISTKKPGSSISADCLSETVSDCSADLLDVTDSYKISEPSDPGTPTNTTYEYDAGATVAISTRRRLLHRNLKRRQQRTQKVQNGLDANRRLLWQQQDWSSNSSDVFDSEGVKYEILSFPEQYYYSPMIVADTETESLYGADYSYSSFGVGLNSFEDANLTGFCSIRVEAQDYSGAVLYVNNDTQNVTTIKREVREISLGPGEYVECVFELFFEEYEAWVSEELDVSEKAYAFEFDFSLTLFETDENGAYNLSDPYDAIIEKRKITVCTPLYRLRDRVVCENGLRWFEPQYDLSYECDEAADVDGVGDGFCDASNNVGTCYDGGDCCESTCVPGDEYNCEYFDCMDDRTIGFSYYTCSNITGFVNYVNGLADTGGGCESGLLSGDFTCSYSVWFAATGNDCVDSIMYADGTFGEFETCANNTWNSLSDVAQSALSVILECVQALDDTDDTYDGSNSFGNGTSGDPDGSDGDDGDSAMRSAVSVFSGVICLVMAMNLVWK